MRHEILDRENEFKIPTNFHKTIGNRHDIEDARLGKETVFGTSQFGVVIENFSHRGFFSEKILDCFLLKTIPLYWGCPNIGDFFNTDGILTFNDVDDLVYKVNNLDENYYKTKIQAVEGNYKLAIEYVNYERNMVDSIKEIFAVNQLI